jgi:predicted ATPase
MVTQLQKAPERDLSPTSLYIVSFEVSGGIFGGHHTIEFPKPPASGAEPGIVILAGRNGSGKTTILRMISGILANLDFNPFRQVPFDWARLSLSDGNQLHVKKTNDEDFPLVVTFADTHAKLYKRREQDRYSPSQKKAINAMREATLPLLRQISFELLDIHRSLALREVDTAEPIYRREILERRYGFVTARDVDQKPTLSNRVQRFMQEAQVNYRRFFAADELELLPRILKRFDESASKPATPEELRARVANVQSRFSTMKRFGLQTDDADLKTLSELLHSDKVHNAHSLALIEGYVEMQESRHEARELIAKRLVEFEKLMDSFLVGKSVRIDARAGLEIRANGEELSETDLSSGEYHFLYMMVAALLCQRSGTIIAIDEPELSLHVSWQRNVIGALARCAAGASPVFLFATHSPAISAEHIDQVYSLSPNE